jgi:hypothetical protein
VIFVGKGGTLSGEPAPATRSIDHISPSMTDKRGTGKITKGSCYSFYYFSLSESEDRGWPIQAVLWLEWGISTAKFHLYCGVIPKARAFTSGPRDLPCNRPRREIPNAGRRKAPLRAAFGKGTSFTRAVKPHYNQPRFSASGKTAPSSLNGPPAEKCPTSCFCSGGKTGGKPGTDGTFT